MRCSFCGKQEATFRVEQTFGEEQTVHWVCVDCAEMAGLLTELPPRMPRPAELFEELLIGGEDGGEEKLCPQCGTTYRDLRDQGRLGCPDCYTHFHQEIDALIGTAGNAYSGSLPARLESLKTFYVDREALREQLRSALDHERYEEAAHLRDAIRIIDSQGER